VVITFRGKPCAKLVPYMELVQGMRNKNELDHLRRALT